MSTAHNANHANIQPVRGFGSLTAFAPAADGHAVELLALAALDVSGHGVAAVRERKEGTGDRNTLFMDLTSGESIEFSDRAAFVAWAAKESLQPKVVATILEVCAAEGALPDVGVLDPSWALHAHEFHVGDTWQDYDNALRATKTRLVEEGMLIDLPLDAPSALRCSAQWWPPNAMVAHKSTSRPCAALTSSCRRESCRRVSRTAITQPPHLAVPRGLPAGHARSSSQAAKLNASTNLPDTTCMAGRKSKSKNGCAKPVFITSLGLARGLAIWHLPKRKPP